MRLAWHDYKYYPYERDLAAREISAVFGPCKLRETSDGIELTGASDTVSAGRLTYISGAFNDHGFVPTIQAKLEVAGRNGRAMQATRYSVHGMHDYKGKFNPQVARALLNIFEIGPRQHVLDPFCGSGTTLVECAHLGAAGVGIDINPLAIAIARAKLKALSTPADQIRKLYEQLYKELSSSKRAGPVYPNDARRGYLESWFHLAVLEQIEYVRSKIELIAGDLAPVFLIIASNLLRDYSYQDPNDLRTRRRKSALPQTPFDVAFLDAVPPLLKRIAAAQAVLGTNVPLCTAVACDVTRLTREQVGTSFDAAITSPPYAMALPYIDTQRLSLVWLRLVQPHQIASLEAELIGSRELRGEARRRLPEELQDNADSLPPGQVRICIELQRALDKQDGFRRKAVPMLLYRYFSLMKNSFKAAKTVMKPDAPYGLIVGHNRTTIGGVRREIDTPRHLSELARAEGWKVEELIPLQTYNRYGYHASNAVANETLIVLRNA